VYGWSCRCSDVTFCALPCVIVVDKVPDRANMVGQLFRERECLSNQSTTTLPQGIVEPLDMTGLTTLLSDRTMAFRWQDCGIRLPKIGVADGTLAIEGRQRSPQSAYAGFGPRSDRHTDNFAGLAVKSQPNPLLTSFLANIRPEFITFQNQAPFLLCNGHRAWNCGIFIAFLNEL
jgi:hypothetical protein